MTVFTSYDATTSPLGHQALESASANPVHFCGRDRGGRVFQTSAYFGPTDRATMLLPSLSPNFLGEYGRGLSGYSPPLVRDSPNGFELMASVYWLPVMGELKESLRKGTATRLRLEMSERQTPAVATAEE